MLECMGGLLQSMVGPTVLVRCAHMELAEPTIADGVAACVAAGATEVIAFPYMLSPGKHSTRDIPRLVAEAARSYPGLAVRVTPAFGVHASLATVIAERAGVAIAPAASVAADRCWSPRGHAGECGDACVAHGPAAAEATTPSAPGAAVGGLR